MTHDIIPVLSSRHLFSAYKRLAFSGREEFVYTLEIESVSARLIHMFIWKLPGSSGALFRMHQMSSD